MRKSILIIYCLFFTAFTVSSQVLKGIVLDQRTNFPIESAAVYFDGTSIGTATNAQGEFKIQLIPGVKSPLIISFMGYQKTLIATYESNKFYKVLLTEDINTLDEVIISADDGMPKEIKLRDFRNQFLGRTENGKSCKILNESDLILKFNAKTNQLTASSKKPIKIQNDNLRYLVTFDIQDFIISYKNVDLLDHYYGIESVVYTGTSFFKDLDSINKKKTIKKRDKTYEGSVLHFMRALFRQQLKEERYQVFYKGFKVPDDQHITVDPVENSTNVKVTISQRVNILFDKKRQSVIEENTDGFIIDQYGNYAPIEKVLFGGDMGSQRIGDSLPFDYQFIVLNKL